MNASGSAPVDRLDEIKVALASIAAPWARPTSTDPPEKDGEEDKIIFGSDPVSAPFEGGGFCVVGHMFSALDANFAAQAPDRLQWAVAEIERLREDAKQHQRFVDAVNGDHVELERLIIDRNGLDATMKHFGVRAFAAEMGLLLKEHDAKNYVEASFYHHDFGPILVTVQKKWGKTPNQLRLEVTAERDEALRRIKSLEETLGAVADAVRLPKE